MEDSKNEVDLLKEERKKVQELVVRLRTEGKLPKQYGAILEKSHPQFNRQAIFNVANGRYYNQEIIDAIIQLAKDSYHDNQRVREQAKEIEDLLS